MHVTNLHSGHSLRRCSFSSGQHVYSGSSRAPKTPCRAFGTAERKSDRSASTSGRTWAEQLRGPVCVPVQQDWPQRIALERLYQLNGQHQMSWDDPTHPSTLAPTIMTVTETLPGEAKSEGAPQEPAVGCKITMRMA